MIEASVLALAMLCSGVSASVFTTFLIQRRRRGEIEVNLSPGQVIVEGSHRWRIHSRVINNWSTSTTTTIELVAMEQL